MVKIIYILMLEMIGMNSFLMISHSVGEEQLQEEVDLVEDDY